MTTKRKAAPGANRAASGNAADHSGNHNATAQEIGKSPAAAATTSPYGPDFVQIGSDEAMRRALGGEPGVIIVRLAHDDWCKTLRTGRGGDCCCDPDESFWLLSEQIGGAA